MHSDIKQVLYPEEQIRKRVRELGQTITQDMAGEDVVLLALLKGSVIFFADLIRNVASHIRVDFAWVSSYGDGTTSRGVELKVFPDEDLSGKTVVVVDDILDTGRTLAAVVHKLRSEQSVKDVKTCVLLDKKARRVVELEADWVGFHVEDFFVVGYGLDYADRYRNLPYIGVLNEHCYQTEDAPGEAGICKDHGVE
ncbi:MAG: hypoxanthine phosphoribosyltransferase [Planctomycetes bacterium]|nr:hypoxanthine phosphoribosyltransferase [Planctomycetota bacterium]